MKYEIIFGDEKLFDGAPLDSVCVERFINTELVSVYVHYRTIDALLNTLIEREAVSCASNRPDIAIRRIIKEPKRWTWEDKKAGRLPEVGAYVFFGKKGKNVTRIAEFIGTGIIDSVWCLKLRCGSYVFVESEIVSPIETPAEKAQREEDEFVDSLRSVEIHDGTVSGFFNQGARAAYRKLKGGW